MKSTSVLMVVLLVLAVSSNPAAQQPPSQGDDVPPRIGRLGRWLSAIEAHRPGVLDEHVRLINTWSQEELRRIWADVSTIVSLIREPGVSIFFVREPVKGPQNPLATPRSTQVLYTFVELRSLRAIAKRVSPDGKPGPENDVVKRGAMLHAGIEILDDGHQRGLSGRVSHWNMGRRLLDGVRPVEKLRLAERLYRRVIEQNPSLVEARIRLGRLTAGEPVLRYYANLFLAGELQALGKGAEARQSYERAAALAPRAQSPLLGLSRVADRAGDRTAARGAIARLLALPTAEFERADPWWVYELVQARHVDRLLTELRQEFEQTSR